MAKLLNSFIAIHPGEILKEELQARNISQKSMAEIIGVPYTMLNEVLNGKREVSTKIALLFEAAIGVNADMLINIQARYNLQVARKNVVYVDLIKSIRKLMCEMFVSKQVSSPLNSH